MAKKTLVLGASEKTDRYSNMAVHRLLQHHHPVLAIGGRTGTISEGAVSVKIETDFPEPQTESANNIDTITLYLNPENQKKYYDSILALNPKRIIFNPGTENPELDAQARKKGIETVEGCTLVMLGTNQY